MIGKCELRGQADAESVRLDPCTKSGISAGREEHSGGVGTGRKTSRKMGDMHHSFADQKTHG